MRLSVGVAALLAVAPAHAQAPVEVPVESADEAVARAEASVRARPTDATALRLLGAAYAAAGRYRDAAATLALAQRIAPGDRDIALARARVAMWDGRHRRAGRIADAIAAAEPANPELPALRAALRDARAGAGGGMSVSQGFSRVSSRAGSRTWSETGLAISAPAARGATLTGEIERFDRGRLVDTRGGVRVDARLGPGLRAHAGASATPRADFRERWSLRAGGEAELGGAFTATLDARYADYGRAGVVAIEPGVRMRTRGGRIEVALRSINLIDETGGLRAGGAARVDAVASPRVRLFAGVATYGDAEGGVTRRVDAAFAGADMDVARGLSLRVTIDGERRASTYRRGGVALGLRWRPGA